MTRRPRPDRATATARPTSPAEVDPHYRESACLHLLAQESLHCDKPTEGIWSHLKRSLANAAVHNVTNLARLAKNRLKRMQYVPTLVDGFLAGTGLSPPANGP
jgi:hypothetical protein